MWLRCGAYRYPLSDALAYAVIVRIGRIGRTFQHSGDAAKLNELDSVAQIFSLISTTSCSADVRSL